VFTLNYPWVLLKNIESILGKVVLNLFEEKKEKEDGLIIFYGRFLSTNTAIIARPTMISTNSPAIAGTKYKSAAEAG
jgi:hypothetical protein